MTVTPPVAPAYTRSDDGIYMPIWIRRTKNREDYTLSWKQWLVKGETDDDPDDSIVDVTCAIDGPAIDIISIAAAPNTTAWPSGGNVFTTVWVFGGVFDSDYPLIPMDWLITTNFGRQHERTSYLVIAEK